MFVWNYIFLRGPVNKSFSSMSKKTTTDENFTFELAQNGGGGTIG